MLSKPSRVVRLAVPVLLLLARAGYGAPTTYSGSLTGPAENPPNASPGTGTATVVIDTAAHTLTVNVSFSGLLGNTTASHIHCCIAAPGNAGVATQTPTFPGFPLGVTSGTYSPAAFDLTNTASFNSAFVTANGGTAAGAEAALAAGLAAGNAYLNVHSSTFTGGEIRSFLVFVSPVELVDFSVD
jgi:CHRD domain